MQLRQDNTQRHVQAQKIAPQLIQANALLQCSNAELLQIIEQEQRENPALDETEDEVETDKNVVEDDFGLREQAEHASESERHGDDGTDLSQIDYDRKDTAAAMPADNDFDPLMLARAQTTLAEQLLMHLRATSHSLGDAHVAEYLVDALDERGYLQIDVEEACLILAVPCSQVQDGIMRLQACDPPGIGARDLRECLQLQMRYLHEQGERYDSISERLIEEYWDALVQRRHGHLARRLGVTPARVETALAFIQECLTPHPAAQFRQPWEHRPDTASTTVRPDVIIKRGAMGFEIEVLGFENLALHINPHYRNLYESIRESRGSSSTLKAGKPPLSDDHQKHVIAYVERANLFLKNLQQRRRTIQKISLALVENQQGFLEMGQRRFLRPMTRTRLAEIVGMHESTISRALLHKYVQLPTQEVVPFDIFFEQSVSVKEAVAVLIASEDPDLPLSDQAITEVLKTRGALVARRTVVKYREELRIPASYLRRRR